ncbi:MAG: hypothetical protein KBT34_04910 [Prevotella sp.]|nr:hypothetical protein [Candidatus Prevotella equi]
MILSESIERQRSRTITNSDTGKEEPTKWFPTDRCLKWKDRDFYRENNQAHHGV